MADQSFREIQLGSKQLVFLFMASVVLAVAVFLLGVSVGRGVPRNASAEVTADASAVDLVPPGETPPPVVMSADDGKFHNILQGKASEEQASPGASTPAAAIADAPEVDEPRPPAAPNAGTTVAAARPAPSAPAVAKPTPPAAPERTAAAKPGPVSPVGQAWSVQIDAFKSRENAEKQIAQLKAQGYSAFVSPSGGLFRVRVGPFAERAEADRTNTRLRQEGFRSSVTR